MYKMVFLIAVNLLFIGFTVFYLNDQRKREFELRSIHTEYKEKFESFDTLQFEKLMSSRSELQNLIEKSNKLGFDSLAVFLLKHAKLGYSFVYFRNNLNDEIKILEFDIDETEKAARLLLMFSIFTVGFNIVYVLGSVRKK